MRGIRVLELVFGVAAGAVGLAALGWAFFSPIYAGQGSVCDSNGMCQTYALPMLSVVQDEGLGTALPIMLFFGSVIVGIMVGAALDGWWAGGSRRARKLLWTCTTLLLGCIVLSLLSIGAFFVPSFGCGVIASGIAAIHARSALAA